MRAEAFNTSGGWTDFKFYSSGMYPGWRMKGQREMKFAGMFGGAPVWMEITKWDPPPVFTRSAFWPHSVSGIQDGLPKRWSPGIPKSSGQEPL